MEPSRVVRQYVDAVQQARRRGAEESWQRVAALLVPDACWRFAGGGGEELWPEQWNGREAIMTHLRDPGASWSRLRTETVSVHPSGPIVVVEQVTTLVDDAGRDHVKPVAHIFTVIDGCIGEIRTYRNDASAP